MFQSGCTMKWAPSAAKSRATPSLALVAVSAKRSPAKPAPVASSEVWRAPRAAKSIAEQSSWQLVRFFSFLTYSFSCDFYPRRGCRTKSAPAGRLSSRPHPPLQFSRDETSLIVSRWRWDIPDEASYACTDGCRNALAAGWSILASGGSALEAVEASIITLEDIRPRRPAYGSHLNRDGQSNATPLSWTEPAFAPAPQAGLHRLKNPIRLARKFSSNVRT